ncbi:MAG: hypothetical protein ACLTSG_14260 [Lachnospiraceae bacterium]
MDNIVEIYGCTTGYVSLRSHRGDYKMLMDSRDFSGILAEGGTILGAPVRCIRTAKPSWTTGAT